MKIFNDMENVLGDSALSCTTVKNWGRGLEHGCNSLQIVSSNGKLQKYCNDGKNYQKNIAQYHSTEQSSIKNV